MKLSLIIYSYMAIVNDLHFAIKNRLNIRFFYSGDETVKAGYRNVDIYAIGKLKGSGRLAILGYFRSGVSLSDETPYWRTYRVDRIKALSLTSNKYNIRSSYRRYPKQFASIDFQL